MQSNIASHTKNTLYYKLFNELSNSGELVNYILTFRKLQNFMLYDEHRFLAVINTHLKYTLLFYTKSSTNKMRMKCSKNRLVASNNKIRNELIQQDRKT